MSPIAICFIHGSHKALIILLPLLDSVLNQVATAILG